MVAVGKMMICQLIVTVSFYIANITKWLQLQKDDIQY